MLTAAGSWSKQIEGLELLVADSATFRAAVGASNRYQARQRVHLGAQRIGEVTAPERPAAILSLGGGAALQISQTEQVLLGSSGQVVLALVANAEQGDDERDAYMRFCNFAGQVIDDVADNSGKDYDSDASVYWPFENYETVIEPTRSQLAHRSSDDFFLAVVAWNWTVD